MATLKDGELYFGLEGHQPVYTVTHPFAFSILLPRLLDQK